MTLEAPSNLTITPFIGGFDLRWTDNSDKENEFRIQGATNGGPWNWVGTVPKNVTTFQMFGIATPRSAYSFRVRAQKKQQFSAWSIVATFTVPLPAPVVIYAQGWSSGVMPPGWTQWAGGNNAESWQVGSAQFGALLPLAQGAYLQDASITNLPKCCVTFPFSTAGYPVGHITEIVDLYDDALNEICDVYLCPDGRLQLFLNSDTPKTSAIPLNTTVRIWLRYEANSPGQAFGSVGWALDGEPEPTSGPQYAQVTNGYFGTNVFWLLFGPVTSPHPFIYGPLKITV